MFNCNEYKYKNTSLLYLNSDIKTKARTYIEKEAHENNSIHLPFQVAIHTYIL